MKRTTIKIKRYTSNVNIVNNNNLGNRIFNILLCSLCACALSYALILGSMTFNIVARQSLGVNARDLSNEVGNLELKYLAMSNAIDIAMSSDMGFKESKIKYATRQSLGTLSLSTNEL